MKNVPILTVENDTDVLLFADAAGTEPPVLKKKAIVNPQSRLREAESDRAADRTTRYSHFVEPD